MFGLLIEKIKLDFYPMLYVAKFEWHIYLIFMMWCNVNYHTLNHSWHSVMCFRFLFSSDFHSQPEIKFWTMQYTYICCPCAIELYFIVDEFIALAEANMHGIRTWSSLNSENNKNQLVTMFPLFIPIIIRTSSTSNWTQTKIQLPWIDETNEKKKENHEYIFH